MTGAVWQNASMAQSVEISTVEHLSRAIEGLTDKINKLDSAGKGLPRGSGVALQELRKIVNGVGKSGEGLTGLATGFTSLSKSVDAMARAVRQNTRTVISAFERLPVEIAEAMADAGPATRKAGEKLARDLEEGTSSGLKAAAARLKRDRKLVSNAINNADGDYQRYSPASGLKGTVVNASGESARYAEALKDLAARQAKSDLEYAALRKDSLARGKIVIIKAAKDASAQLQAELKQQVQEIQTVAKYRAGSATKMGIEDTRHLLGMPSRESMQAFAAQLQAEMKQQVQQVQAASKWRVGSASKMGIEDTRHLLGMPSRADMQAFASQLEGEMKQQAARLRQNSVWRGKSAPKVSLEDTRSLLGMPSSATIAALGADIRERAVAEAQKIRRAVAAATNNASGSYQRYNPSTGVAGGMVGNLAAAAKQPTVAPPAMPAGMGSMGGNMFRKLGDDMGYAHSAARGLSSGFGLLYLTWGKLLPLLGGASISFGIRKVFDVGSEVEYNIEFMRLMGEQSKESSQVIRESLRSINTETKFTLTELSQAMVALGQAGKTPTESLKMIKPVADLATAGMVDLKTSYNLITQAQALYGLGIDDTAKLASQLIRVTQQGKLNVEDLGGAFKYASEAETRFGQSIESTLTLFGALAEAGIKTNAAGTSYINFMRDIAGRSGPAIKAMDELRKRSGMALEIFKKDGTLKDGVEVISQLAEAFKKVDGKTFQEIIGKLTSARGGRTFFAAIREAPGDLREIQKGLENIDVTLAAQQAKGLMETTRGEMDKLRSNFSNTLDEIFAIYSDRFKEFFKSLSAAVTSSEFKLALSSIVSGFVTFGAWIKENFTLIKTLVSGFVALKAAAMAVNLMGTLGAGLAAMAPLLTTSVSLLARKSAALFTARGSLVAYGAQAVQATAYQGALNAGVGASAAKLTAQSAAMGLATRSGTVLAGVIGFLANPVVGLVVTLGILAGTWWATSRSGQDASDDLSSKVIKDSKLNVAQLEKELKLLRERELLGSRPPKKATEDLRKATWAEREGLKAQLEKNGGDKNQTPWANKLRTQIAEKGQQYRDIIHLQAESDAQLDLDMRKEAERKRKAEAQSQAAAMRAAMAGLETPDVVPNGPGKADTAKQYATELERIAKAFDKMRIGAQELTPVEAKLQELLESDAYKAATPSIQKFHVEKAFAALAAEEDRAAIKLENEQLAAQSEILGRNAKAYADRLDARELADDDLQKGINRLREENGLLEEKLQLSRDLQFLSPTKKAQGFAAFDLNKKYGARAEEIKLSGGSDASVAGALDANEKERIREMAISSATIYKDSWDSVTSEISKSFVSQMMDGTLNLKEFLIDTFANMVLRPQLELAVNQGMSMLFKAGLSFLGLPSFDGGGSTGSGPRTGGMDGRGGFPAMLHPQETVTDHTKGGAGGGANVTVNIYNTVGDVATKSMLDKYHQSTLRQVQSGIGRSLKYNGALG